MMWSSQLGRWPVRLTAALSMICWAAAFAQTARAAPDDIRAHMLREANRSRPDYLVYIPGHWDGSTHDSHNEHFLVFEGPDGSLMAVWTQSLDIPGPKNRIVFSRSTDGGRSWTPPVHVAGPRTADDPAYMASWGFPMVARSGRIYVIYNQHQGVSGWVPMHTGTMDGRYSDDLGRTWSAAQTIPMPKSPYDDPSGKVPAEWIVWQIPMRDRSGGFFVGYTHWVNPAKASRKKVEAWTQMESVCEFMRFQNVDENPEPKDLKVVYSGWGDQALRVPHYKYPTLSIAQEPSLVRLPDQRLFCVMRSNSGYIWYSVSSDDGQTWCNPRPLLRRDHGDPILQPVSCCPIYQLADGRYLLLHHNNRGDIDSRPERTAEPRRPAFIALGEFRRGADQPIWFSESEELLDNGGFTPAGTFASKLETRTTAIAVYTSFTTRDGVNILWYPDRKCFLLGKRIEEVFLQGLTVRK